MMAGSGGARETGDVSERLFGTTDYPIPRFGFLQSFGVFLLLIVAAVVVPEVMREVIGVAWRIPSAVLGGMITGFAFSLFRSRGNAGCSLRAGVLSAAVISALAALVLLSAYQ